MSRDFKLDANGDVVIDGDIQTISDNNELAQRIVTTLRTRLDEFEPEDSPMGLTRENALGKAYNEDYLREDITDAISDQVDPSINVNQITFERDQALRTLTVTLNCTLPNGSNQIISTDLGGEY